MPAGRGLMSPRRTASDQESEQKPNCSEHCLNDSPSSYALWISVQSYRRAALSSPGRSSLFAWYETVDFDTPRRRAISALLRPAFSIELTSDRVSVGGRFGPMANTCSHEHQTESRLRPAPSQTAPQGLEPRIPVPETGVLPLHQGATNDQSAHCRRGRRRSAGKASGSERALRRRARRGRCLCRRAGRGRRRRQRRRRAGGAPRPDPRSGRR
jgi:hypothetical protein